MESLIEMQIAKIMRLLSLTIGMYSEKNPRQKLRIPPELCLPGSMQKIIAEPGENAFRYINDTVGAALIPSLILFSMGLLFLFTRIKGRTRLKYKSILIHILRNKKSFVFNTTWHCVNNNIKVMNAKFFVAWFYSRVLSKTQIQYILILICHYLASI
jgi:hypothetical protein